MDNHHFLISRQLGGSTTTTSTEHKITPCTEQSDLQPHPHHAPARSMESLSPSMDAGARDVSDPDSASSNPAVTASRSAARRSTRRSTQLSDEFHDRDTDRDTLSPEKSPSSAATSEPAWLQRTVAAVQKINTPQQLSTDAEEEVGGLLPTSSSASDVLPTLPAPELQQRLASLPPASHDDFLASARRPRRAAPSEPKLHSAYAPPGGDAPDLASHDDLLVASRLEAFLAKLEAISALSPNPESAAFLLAHDEVLARKVRVVPTRARESKLTSCFL